jgi:hypothetical protein
MASVRTRVLGRKESTKNPEESTRLIGPNPLRQIVVQVIQRIMGWFGAQRFGSTVSAGIEK